MKKEKRENADEYESVHRTSHHLPSANGRAGEGPTWYDWCISNGTRFLHVYIFSGIAATIGNRQIRHTLTHTPRTAPIVCDADFLQFFGCGMLHKVAGLAVFAQKDKIGGYQSKTILSKLGEFF